MTGVRAELEIESPSDCPVAAVSAGAGSEVTDVSRAGAADGLVEEFRVDAPDADEHADVEPVFEYGSEQVYRLERSTDEPCVCEAVEALDCPVADVRAERGSLFLTLHLADTDRFRDVIASLRDRGENVAVRYLVRTADGHDEGGDSVVVDRDRLTERQAEVIETAHEMGYFRYPRGSNATEVSGALGIEPSTFAEHLAAAQSKLMSQLLD